MTVRVAIAQMHVNPSSRSTNQRRAVDLIDRAANCDPAPEIICLPGRCAGDCDGQDPTPAMTDTFLGVLAGKAREHGVSLAAGLIEADRGSLYDSAVLFDVDGDILLKHRRIHLRPGEAPRLSCGLHAARACLMLYGGVGLLAGEDACSDTMVRDLAGMGAELIIAPCCWPNPVGPAAALTAAAQSAGAWVVMINQAGGSTFGHSRIVSPAGVAVCEASGSEGICTQEIRLDRS